MSAAAASHRDRYSPALQRLLSQLEQEGLMPAVRSGRVQAFDSVSRLAGLGLVSSSTIRVGENVWRLRFTRVGSALRKLLAAEAVRK